MDEERRRPKSIAEIFDEWHKEDRERQREEVWLSLKLSAVGVIIFFITVFYLWGKT